MQQGTDWLKKVVGFCFGASTLKHKETGENDGVLVKHFIKLERPRQNWPMFFDVERETDVRGAHNVLHRNVIHTGVSCAPFVYCLFAAHRTTMERF